MISMEDKKQCPKCGAMVSIKQETCPGCGYEFEEKEDSHEEQFAN